MSVAAGEVLMENSRISGLSWSYSDQSPQQPAVCIFAAVCINCTHTNYAKLLRTTDPHAATTDPLILISIIMSQKATWYVDIWSSLRLNEWWCMASILSTKFSQYSEQQLPSVFFTLQILLRRYAIQAITQNTWLTATDWSIDEDLCKPNRLLVFNFPDRVPSRDFYEYCEMFVKFRWQL